MAAESPESHQASNRESSKAATRKTIDSIRASLHQNQGPLWRHKTRILLIIGEPAQIQAIAPGLAEHHWLESQNAVLLWGGSAQTSLTERFTQWRSLRRWRALDGVVWAVDNTQSANATFMAAGVRHVQALARELHWQLPLHLWQVCDSAWPQPQRATEPVGCLLPPRFTPAQLEASLTSLQQPLREQGIAQMQTHVDHDFLLRLSRDLGDEGIAHWRRALEPFRSASSRGVVLRGLWFSLPLPGASATEQHHWPAEPSWQGVLNDDAPTGRLGWTAPRVGYAVMLCLVVMWGAGLLLSFVSNRAHIEQLQTSLATLQQPADGDAQLLALNEWVRELARLDYRARHGAPWYQRFGLNQNHAVSQALWPQYIKANNRLMRDPAAANLERKLIALVKLPPDSPERLTQAPAAYEHLKAYLMMARPEKTDAAFLAKALGSAEPTREGLTPGVWQGVSPGLWQFYSEQLAAHPDWRIEPDATLVAQVRQILLSQLSRRNAEGSQYRKILDTAAKQYPPRELADMVGDTNASMLFSSTASVPGVFTREAWEGRVRPAIDDLARTRREVIDWVLSDQPGDIAADLTPDRLKQGLTERYFQDYSRAWLSFLNTLRWQKTDRLADVVDQLTLMSDARQSPLIALLNTLAYQGKASTQEAVSGALLTSAQQLIGEHEIPEIGPVKPTKNSSLDATFGPILALVDKGADGQQGDDHLSLQTFLTRVTRVRLKLQQILLAADPQDMTQALAQTVFQGKGVDLTDTQSYGSLIAASLGHEWSGIGRTLFVEPLEHAWQHVLQPSAAGLNSRWQRSIVSDWNAAFDGRYPFAATGSDASLPMLGQMIRADSGRIEQFLQRELQGVLRKDGSRWVADTRNSQGLRINPHFLAALNRLSELADVLYTDGGMGLNFELQGKAVRDVVQTSLTLNGERHHYFNQKERWQRFRWPGDSDHPGASLTWTGVNTGERLFGEYQGTWALIRLLENAQMTALDDGDTRYRIVLEAPDGLNLTWHLRTELGAGPMALLTLRQFRLPRQIFLSDAGHAQPLAQNEAYE